MFRWPACLLAVVLQISVPTVLKYSCFCSSGIFPPSRDTSSIVHVDFYRVTKAWMSHRRMQNGEVNTRMSYVIGCEGDPHTNAM